jgi:hypothetical protein
MYSTNQSNQTYLNLNTNGLLSLLIFYVFMYLCINVCMHVQIKKRKKHVLLEHQTFTDNFKHQPIISWMED